MLVILAGRVELVTLTSPGDSVSQNKSGSKYETCGWLQVHSESSMKKGNNNKYTAHSAGNRSPANGSQARQSLAAQGWPCVATLCQARVFQTILN